MLAPFFCRRASLQQLILRFSLFCVATCVTLLILISWSWTAWRTTQKVNESRLLRKRGETEQDNSCWRGLICSKRWKAGSAPMSASCISFISSINPFLAFFTPCSTSGTLDLPWAWGNGLVALPAWGDKDRETAVNVKRGAALLTNWAEPGCECLICHFVQPLQFPMTLSDGIM